MSATSSKTLTRLCIGGVAAATIGSALVLPFASPASAKTAAGPTTTVTISPKTAFAVQNNCTPYTVTATDQTGGAAVNQPVNVLLTNPNSSSVNPGAQDLGFCQPTAADNTTPLTPPGATTVGAPQPPTVTQGAGDFGNPGQTSNGNPQATQTGQTATQQTVTTDGSGRATVYVYATQPGTVDVRAYFDANGNGMYDAGVEPTDVAVETVDPNFNTNVNTPGNNFVRTVTATPIANGNNAPTQYLVTLRDKNGAPVNNVVPNFVVTSGPGSTNGTTQQGTPCAAPTNYLGQTTCTVPLPMTNGTVTPGTQNITFFSDQDAPGFTPQVLDSTEPRTSVTRTVAAPAANASKVTVTPNGQTFPAGQDVTYTISVTDAQGNPATGVTPTVTVSGAAQNTGTFRGRQTDNTGTTTFVVRTGINQTGPQSLTADITNGAGTPFAPAPTACTTTAGGAGCMSTATNTISTSSVTAPTTAPTTAAPSATPTATTSPSATPTATTSPSTSPSARPSVSPSPSGSVSPPAGVQCTNPAGITLNRSFIVPGIPVTVTITAPEGAEVELQAYSRPSSTFRQVRQGVAGPNGTVSFDVTPGTNTRLFADCVSQTNSASASKVINVRTALSLSVVRNGRRDYTFQGTILPHRAGQLITLYRVKSDGTRVRTATVTTNDSGQYFINRKFTGSGTFGFLARTGQTLTNASGESTSRARSTSADYLDSGRGTARPTSIR